MSDLSCPVCSAPFREVLREGILIDVCTQCRGVWLDRGELEKLLSLAGGADTQAPSRAAEVRQSSEPPRQGYAQPSQGYRRDDDDDDYKPRQDGHDQNHYGRKPMNKPKKKGFDFADIFDFGD